MSALGVVLFVLCGLIAAVVVVAFGGPGPGKNPRPDGTAAACRGDEVVGQEEGEQSK